MATPSSASTSELRHPAGLDDSLAADLRRLVSSSELHRLCASATTERQAPVAAASDKGDGVVSWGISTETQQALAMRTSSFAHFNLTPEDVHQWRLEQQRLETFAAESRRLCRSAAAPLAESIGPIGGSMGRESVTSWHLGASAESHGQRPTGSDPSFGREPGAASWVAKGAGLATQLAVQGQNGTAIYAPISSGHCCGTAHCAAAHHLENCAGAHHLAAFAGLSGHQQMSQASLQAASIPIESAANDLALQVANLRNPQRLRAIRHCLEDSQMSHLGPMMTPALPPQLATPAPAHAHELSKPAHRRHNHRAEQKKVLKQWFDRHALDPYPSNDEKIDLAQKANMDVKQVENWFTNRRKRNWRHVKEDDEPGAVPQLNPLHEPACSGGTSSGGSHSNGGAHSGVLTVAAPPADAHAAEAKRQRVAGA